MTLNELLIVKAALNGKTPSLDNFTESRARDIVEREIRLKELERTLNTKEGNDTPKKREHQWEFYMNGSFCKVCGAAIGSGVECK